jgi:glycosyltransferase involved in cell wall biosynthesis
MYKPEGLEITDSPSDSDLVILHITGRHDGIKAQIDLLNKYNKPYAMIQYVLRSTKNPSTSDWLDMWQNARLVWSYYYLPELCFEDKVHEQFPFYYAPLGVDTSVFYDRKSSKGHKAAVIATNSRGLLTESAKECIQAGTSLDRKVFFLGEEVNIPGVFCKTNITDDELAYYYSISEFVSGLRRIEGFELPAAEGLMCGARPIMFNKPHYRAWFENMAVYIEEGNREQVQTSLEKVFKKGSREVTEAELQRAKQIFNWETIIKGFWDRLLI